MKLDSNVHVFICFCATPCEITTEVAATEAFNRRDALHSGSLMSYGVCLSVCPSVCHTPVLCLNG